jgi:TM2 domain-containing membrane protein YozV
MMPFTDSIYTANMSARQRAWFHAEYEQASKDESIGVLLALFLGCFGLHHFYLRRNGLGIFYILISWTGISTILGIIECFFMPGRVREYNAMQASYIASYILSTPQPELLPCAACGAPMEPNAAFCTRCGAPAANREPLPSA